MGYVVRGTVRSEETATRVHKTHGKGGDKLSFAIVKDAAASGALVEAVKGIDGKTVPEPLFLAFADVRDAAEAHRLAYETPDANGQRARTRTPKGQTGAPISDVHKVSNENA
ncbi:MAG: methylglyoxal reductase (NADPH-dependent) gre2 [Candelina submexicana]|nr:MAG: methylglyoxal reductase (NADPH-dependent) gre2 [Candelina submexicana]